MFESIVYTLTLIALIATVAVCVAAYRAEKAGRDAVRLQEIQALIAFHTQRPATAGRRDRAGVR